VGTWVYIKLQPYVQSFVAARANQKLAYRFFGPFLITDKIGIVAYKLKLPNSSSIRPVFHVSQLKVAVPVTYTAQPLPSSLDGLQVPERVLQKRVAKVGVDVHLQALIQWSGMPSSLATWEDMETLRQRFPRAHAWGKQTLIREGMSAPVPLHQQPRRITGTTTASLMFTATFKPSMGRAEEGVTAGPTYESMGQSGSDRPPAGKSVVSFQYM
jgi:hypothetical protein